MAALAANGNLLVPATAGPHVYSIANPTNKPTKRPSNQLPSKLARKPTNLEHTQPQSCAGHNVKGGGQLLRNIIQLVALPRCYHANPVLAATQ